jgi:hypothetical protein
MEDTDRLRTARSKAYQHAMSCACALGAKSVHKPCAKPLHASINDINAYFSVVSMSEARSMHQCMPHQCVQCRKLLQHHTGQL